MYWRHSRDFWVFYSAKYGTSMVKEPMPYVIRNVCNNFLVEKGGGSWTVAEYDEIFVPYMQNSACMYTVLYFISETCKKYHPWNPDLKTLLKTAVYLCLWICKNKSFHEQIYAPWYKVKNKYRLYSQWEHYKTLLKCGCTWEDRH